MPLSLQEKEEQRKKSIRELERKYEKDAKIQAEKQKLVRMLSQHCALSIESVTNLTHKLQLTS